MPLTADTLPVETLSHIFKYAYSQSDREQKAKNLRNFSLLCSTWRYVAQRELFAVVLIDGISTASSMVKEIVANVNHARLGAYIVVLVLKLPNPVDYTLPPDFPQFIRRLTALREITLLGFSGFHLFGGPSTLELRHVLADVFSLPTFTKIASATTYFPFRVLSYCPNLENLLVKWPRDIPPNFEPCDFGQSPSSSPAKLKVLQLTGSAENIAQFNSIMIGPRGMISTSHLRQVALAFTPTLPKGSGTIFSHFESVEDLRIIFIVDAEGDLQLEVDEADISALKNLQTFRIEQQPSPPGAGPPDGRDYFVTGSLFSQWFLGFLANLPNPGKVRELEYIFKPLDLASDEAEGWLDAIEETAGEDDHAFDDVFTEVDRLLTTEFSGLSSFTFSLPWVPQEDVAQMLTELCARGIFKVPSETLG